MSSGRGGGGIAAILYTLKKGREAGGILKMYRAMRTKNACKTCALGMGGKRGGMVNESGQFPEVCKKSLQAMDADMQGRITPEFFQQTSLDQMRSMTPRQLEMSGRLSTPLIAAPGDTHYRPISWDDALERVAEKLRETDPLESFFYFSGRSSNEAGFLLQLMARIYGTNHVNNCSYYCHQASGVGLSTVTGSGTATIVLEDLDQCDLLFLIGANPASNHPRLMRTIVDLRRRGGRVVVINPVREPALEKFRVPSDWRSLLFGSKTCDLYLQPKAGGDIHLLSGIAKHLIESDAVDQEFVDQFADGWSEFQAQIESSTWEEIVEGSGISREQISEVSGLYRASQKTVFAWAMGITHHSHGVGNVQMIGNLAIMRGMIGREGCGLLPLRGHSNVQGIGSMGVVPKLKKAVFDKVEAELGVELPTHKGLDTLGCMEAAEQGEMRTAICLGGNLYGSNPDAAYARRAMNQLDQVVYLSTTLNTGHAAGLAKETIILPVQARDEEKQVTTQESMYNFVRISDGGEQRIEGLRSEVEIIADLGSRLFDASLLDWQSLREHGEIRKAIAKIIPGYQEIEKAGETKKEFLVEGRTFHQPNFATDSGRAKMHAVPLPPIESDDGFTLITVRSEGQFNTVVYDEDDRYRGQERRNVVLMNPDDMTKHGFKENQPVRVSSNTGAMPNQLVRSFDVARGSVVMYFPEANILIPRHADPKSKTPAFKSAPVRIEPQT
jgi:molybdopterin-dependent oxidoreductase alpha subunit